MTKRRLSRSCQTGIVVLVLADPVDYRADIETTSPGIGRAIVKDTEVGPMPRQRTGQSESRRQKFTSDTETFRIDVGLKLSPGQPGAIDRSRYSAPIAAAKDRRIHNIDSFVVEAFENCARKVLVKIEDQIDWTEYTPGRWRTTEYSNSDVILLDKDLRPGSGYDIAHINMPPVGAQRQALNPFRAPNRPVGPFIGNFWMQQRVSRNAFLNLRISPESRGIAAGKRIGDQWEVL